MYKKRSPILTLFLLHSMASTTESSCMMEETTQVTVWRCVTTVPSCRAAATADPASTPSGCSEMERKCHLQTHAWTISPFTYTKKDLETSLFVMWLEICKLRY